MHRLASAGTLEPNTQKRRKCPSLSIFGITLARISWKKCSSSDFFASSFKHPLPCQKSCSLVFHFSLSFSFSHLILDTVCFLIAVQAEVVHEEAFDSF